MWSSAFYYFFYYTVQGSELNSMTTVCQREHSYPIKYPRLSLFLCRLLAWLLYSTVLVLLTKDLEKKDSIASAIQSAIVPPEDLEPDLELAKFSAISAIHLFPMIWPTTSQNIAERTLLCSCKGMGAARVSAVRSCVCKYTVFTCKIECYCVCVGFLQRLFGRYHSKSRVPYKQKLCPMVDAPQDEGERWATLSSWVFKHLVLSKIKDFWILLGRCISLLLCSATS